MEHAATTFEDLRELVAPTGQEHLLAHWAALAPEGRASLARDIRDVDFALMDRLHRGIGIFDPDSVPVDRLAAPDVWRAGCDGPGISRAEAEEEGRRLLREGRVACLVVAGGQGTRLGFPGPKGTLPFGPVSGKTLFSIHCAKIRALEKRFGAPLPLVVMTSEANDEATRRYFELHGGFDLAEVRFMKQGSLPALDDRGKLFLATRDRIFRSPNGHGGTVAALARSGLLAELTERGIAHLFYFQVDNPLVKIAEPFFLGAHHRARSEYSLKILRKRSPDEKLGLLARTNNRHFIVEYSDLPAEAAQARDAAGDLLFWAGSPAIHVFSLAFFTRLVEKGIELPYHRARKKIPHTDAAGREIEPAEPNGTKFETFIFDAMPHARTILAVEGVREKEFAPVKNAQGEDSLESAQAMTSRLHWQWLAARGAAVPQDAGDRPCEIHPSFALGPEDIPGDIAQRVKEEGPVYFE
jgi:UDP-N-acetylglucosamine/UDP-N-acetylgalactosamine diphosphorylase